MRYRALWVGKRKVKTSKSRQRLVICGEQIRKIFNYWKVKMSKLRQRLVICGEQIRKICNYWKVKTSKLRQRLVKCGEQIRNYGCVSWHTILTHVACSPLYAAHFAIVVLAQIQFNVVSDAIGDARTDDDVRVTFGAGNNALLSVTAAVIFLFFVWVPTWIIVRSLTSGEASLREIWEDILYYALDDLEKSSRTFISILPWCGLLAACALCYRMDNFDSCLEGAVKDSTADVAVRKCCESASINSTAMVNCSGMTAAFNITTPVFGNATSINSTAAMFCPCDTIVASEICIDYLQPLLHPYVQPLLLLSIVHILLLAPLPAMILYGVFCDIMAYLYKRVFPPRPVNPNSEPQTIC